MTTPIDNFRDIMDTLDRDFRRIAESEYREKTGRIAHRLVTRNLGLANPIVVARGMCFTNPLELPETAQAAERGDITWDETDDLVMADVVVSGTGQDGQQVYVVMEISITVQGKDKATVLRRAGLLERATGVTVIPVAIGISEENQEGDSGAACCALSADTPGPENSP